MSDTATKPKLVKGTKATLKPGMRVTPDPLYPGLPSGSLGREFIVEKVNAVNTRTRGTQPGERGTAFPHEAYLILPDGATPADATVTVADDEGLVWFALGQIVTLTQDWRDWTTKTPLVVLQDTGDTRVRVAKLGGEGDRYARISRKALVKRDLAWLTETLVDAA